MINQLIKLANKLDNSGFNKVADKIDSIIKTAQPDEVEYNQLISTLFGELLKDAPKLLEKPFIDLRQAEATRKELYELLSYISNLIKDAENKI